MPFQPISVTAGQNPLIQFGGMITTHFLPPAPGTSFQLKQIYRARPSSSADHLDDREVADAYRGPPTHFHVHQTERFRVEQGRIGIEVNGKSRIVTPADGVVVCHAGNLHRFWVDVEGEDGEQQEDVVLLLNATDSGKDFVLDRVFFENWYGMRYDSLTYGKGIDFIQMLCTFDAGDHYIPFPASLPSFIPALLSFYIRTFFGYWMTVLIGRYIGSLLGYRPFFREYTSDWKLAQAKAKHTWFHGRNVETSYQQARSWDELHQMSVWSDEKAASMGGISETKDTKRES